MAIYKRMPNGQYAKVYPLAIQTYFLEIKNVSTTDYLDTILVITNTPPRANSNTFFNVYNPDGTVHERAGGNATYLVIRDDFPAGSTKYYVVAEEFELKSKYLYYIMSKDFSNHFKLACGSVTLYSNYVHIAGTGDVGTVAYTRLKFDTNFAPNGISVIIRQFKVAGSGAGYEISPWEIYFLTDPGSVVCGNGGSIGTNLEPHGYIDDYNNYMKVSDKTNTASVTTADGYWEGQLRSKYLFSVLWGAGTGEIHFEVEDAYYSVTLTSANTPAPTSKFHIAWRTRAAFGYDSYQEWYYGVLIAGEYLTSYPNIVEVPNADIEVNFFR